MDNYAAGMQGGGQGGAMDQYMGQGQPSQSQQDQGPTPDQMWQKIQDGVNEVDQYTQALGIPTFDFFKKLGSPEYAGPQGINWDKLSADYQQQQLAQPASK